MAIKEIEEEIVSEFELFDNWDDKYEYIIDLGKKLAPLPESARLPENIIKGCQSTVWLTASFENGLVKYLADSDAVIVRGLISLLIRAMTNHSPDEILSADLTFIDRIGMSTHLAPTRANGLRAMVKQMRMFALAFKSTQKN